MLCIFYIILITLFSWRSVLIIFDLNNCISCCCCCCYFVLLLFLLYAAHASQSLLVVFVCVCFGFVSLLLFCFVCVRRVFLLRFIRIPSLLVWESNSEWMCRRRRCRVVTGCVAAFVALSLLLLHFTAASSLCCRCVGCQTDSVKNQTHTKNKNNNNATLTLSASPAWLIPKKWSSKRGGSDAHVSFRFVFVSVGVCVLLFVCVYGERGVWWESLEAALASPLLVVAVAFLTSVGHDDSDVDVR